MLTLAFEDTYQQCAPMLHSICHRFERVYGLPYEDLISEAHLAFARIYQRWDPAKGASFSTYLYFCTTKKLIDYCNKEMPHAFRPTEELNEETMGSESSTPNWREDFLHELSLSAAMVVRALLDTPYDLRCCLRATRPRSRKDLFEIFREHFESLGWDGDIIAEAFTEIESLLFPRADGAPAPLSRREQRRAMQGAIRHTETRVWLQVRVGLTPERVAALLGG